MKSTDDSFFADSPELPKTGREFGVELIKYFLRARHHFADFGKWF